MAVKKTMDGVTRMRRYIRSVTAKSNKKKYPQSIRLACTRHIQDLENPDFYFDEKSANAAVRYIELLKHTKAQWAGKNIKLEDWQCFVICSLFGWKLESTGYRRFLYFYFQVPRKNGKSLLAICIALIMFGPDNEPGAEIFLGSTDEKVAEQQLLAPAKRIVETCHNYRDHYGIDVRSSTMVRPDNNSFIRTVIRKPSDGDNPHFALVDEYHLHKTSEQYDVFQTGMGARRQPLLMAATTAGFNLGYPCKDEHDDCMAVLQGVGTTDGAKDDRKFIVIYEPDQEDKSQGIKADRWQDFETAVKVNPNIGISVSPDFLKNELATAKRQARKQNDYRTKYLNEWVGAKTAWMNMLAWQRQKKPLQWESFRGKDCCVAVDLASHKDLAAVYCIFRENGKYSGFGRFFIPEESVKGNKRYQNYVSTGQMIATPGAKTDQRVIEQSVIEICRFANVHLVGFDEWQADYMISNLLDHTEPQIPAVVYGQTAKNMSTPMKIFEALVINKEFEHDGSPVMTWNMGNVVALTMSDRQIKPVKQNRNDETCKIDGAVAGIMAVGLWGEYDMEGGTESVYEARGLASV